MKITLVSKDRMTFYADLEVVEMSGTLREMLDGTRHLRPLPINALCWRNSFFVTDFDPMTEEIPITNVNAAILHFVLRYCDYHVNARRENIPGELREIFDNEFIDVDDDTLFHLILVSRTN